MKDYKINVGYLYNDSFTENVFLNAVLKKINDDNSAPSYIFNEMDISKVFRIEFPIFLCDGNAEIKYSRMIGFDKIETTTKYKTNAYGNKTHSTSSRTITDWKKDSGVISGSASSGTILEEYKIYDEYITNHKMDKNNIRVLSNNELKKYKLTDDMIEYLENDILNKVFKNNITYPGNHVKDEEYNGSTSLSNISCTIVSLYALTVSVRDKSITFIAASNGEIDIEMYGEYPLDNFDCVFKLNREITKERLEATKTPRKYAKYTIVATIISFIILLILGISLNLLALTIISISLFSKSSYVKLVWIKNDFK